MILSPEYISWKLKIVRKVNLWPHICWQIWCNFSMTVFENKIANTIYFDGLSNICWKIISKIWWWINIMHLNSFTIYGVLYMCEHISWAHFSQDDSVACFSLILISDTRDSCLPSGWPASWIWLNCRPVEHWHC